MERVQEDAGNWIFVSHSHHDLKPVRRIRDYLEGRGHNPILFYLRCLRDEEELPELIRREIEACNFFVLCTSPNAERSRWVEEERRLVKAMPDKAYEEVDLRAELDTQLSKLESLAKRATIFISYTNPEQTLLMNEGKLGSRSQSNATGRRNSFLISLTRAVPVSMGGDVAADDGSSDGTRISLGRHGSQGTEPSWPQNE